MNKKTTSSKAKKPQASVTERVCLLGFMGAGKTTTAQILAEKLGVQWVDLDEFIEARENRKTAQIIENLGESVFREIETDALREVLHGDEKRVIALGGGTWMLDENRRIIAENGCRTVWLDVPFEMCWQRISNSKRKRPLAKHEDQARKLFDDRQNLYKKADLRVSLLPEKTSRDLALEIFEFISNGKPAAKAKNKKTLTKPK